MKPSDKVDRRPAPKWAALVNDTLIPMPERHVRVEVLRQQSGIPEDHALLRDHNSDHDPLMPNEGSIDLAQGNSLNSVPRCEVESPRPDCAAPAKLAYVVNDRWEIVTRPAQTGRTLRALFALSEDVELLRDRESPDDDLVTDGDDAAFENGCVFRTRHAESPGHDHETKIIVNGREKTVQGSKISYAHLVALAFGAADPKTIYTITFTNGPSANPEGRMVEGGVVKITCGMIFNVANSHQS